MFSAIAPESFDKKMYKKYGKAVLDKRASFGVGIFMFLYMVSVLMNVLVVISTIIIILLMCKAISNCWTKCVEVGLNKNEIKVALFYQIIYPLAIVLIWTGIINELMKRRGYIRRR